MVLLAELDVAGQPEEIRDAGRELPYRIGSRLSVWPHGRPRSSAMAK